MFLIYIWAPENFNFWGEEELRQSYELQSNEVIDLQFRRQRYVNSEQCVPWQVEILSKNRIFFVFQLLDNTI